MTSKTRSRHSSSPFCGLLFSVQALFFCASLAEAESDPQRESPATSKPVADPKEEGSPSEKETRKEPEIVFEDYGKRRRFFEEMQGKKPRKLSCSRWLPRRYDFQKARGKVVMIFFFGAWCKSCNRMLPLVREWQEKYRERGFEVVGLHTVRESEEIETYLEENEIDFPVGVDFKNATVRRYRVSGYPDIFLVDREGILRYANVSNEKARYVTQAIEYLLDEPVPVPAKKDSASNASSNEKSSTGG